MKTITTVLFIILSLSVQAQDIGLIQSKIAKLAVLEGNWSGSGWIQQEGLRSEFTQTEQVVLKLNGTTLLIEGKGFDDDSLVFNAMAIASYDTESGKYRFNSFLNDGKYTEAEGWFDENDVFHWQFEVPSGGTVRYSLTLEPNSWVEHGAYKPKDVDQWYPFMQMELTKLK